MNNDISQKIYELAIGHQVLKFVKALGGENLCPPVESEALALLAEIRAVLDDETLEDPACFHRVDALVRAFDRRGIYTNRHDF